MRPRWQGWLLGVLAIAVIVVACDGQQAVAPADLRSRIGRLLDRGQVDEAMELIGAPARDPGLAVLLGDALALRGRIAEASAAFGRAAERNGADHWYAVARLAEMAERAGGLDEAARLSATVIRGLDPSESLSAADWTAFGVASRILGRSDPARFKDALEALDHAIALDSSWLEPQIRVGDLLLEKYNAPDAGEAYQAVLRRDGGNARALLGLARIRLFRSDPAAYDAARKVVEAGPGLASAQALLARLDLDAESFDSAESRASRAIGLDSTDLSAWAVRGTLALLAGDSAGFRTIERLLESLHQAPARFYVGVAEAMARQRRYRDAATLGRMAVRLEPDDAQALTVLGVNELRLGAIDSGRARLERAFERDPYHVWNKNTLDLLDRLAGYRTVRTRRFELVAAPDQVDLMSLYLGPLLERAYDSLAARYRYRPATPVRLEIYRRHADFSVRTVGLVGLGALGVSFGSVLAMDGPAARDKGEFNWGATAWHELTHAFTLGATDHRVPRWLSEGLSVLEERRAGRGWGPQATLAFLSAYKGGKLESVSSLNDGFVRPDFPAQIPWSYYQASLVCEYLEETNGFDAILALLDAYRRGQSTPEAIPGALGMTPADLDARFDAWFRARFRSALAGVGAARDSVIDPGQLGTLLATGARLRSLGKMDEAVSVLERVQAAFPDQGEPESAAWLLAGIHAARGDTARALAQLTRVTGHNDIQLEANLLEASLRAATGDRKAAMAALERAIYIDPYDPAVHDRLADLASAEGRHEVAIRERRAVLTLDPSDKAEAGYRLALAYRDAGDRTSARREVLKVLEAAPSFERAQTLLLELRERP